MNRLLYTLTIIILTSVSVYGQTPENKKLVQVSGIIIDDLFRPVPGVAVISKKLHRGSISEKSGIYSITSTPGDTIFYRGLGFKRYHTIIPESFQDRHCTVDIILEADTIPIADVTIFPWKTYNDFIKDITKEKPVDPIIENMNDNIASIYVAISNQNYVKVSPEAGFKYAMEQNYSINSTKNQFPVNNLLNPLAWAKFVNGVKHGIFKNQKFNKPAKAKVRKKLKKSDSKK